MASYLLTLRRPTPSSLFNKLLSPIRSFSIAPSVSRSFNTYNVGEVTFLDANDGTIHHEHRASDHSAISCSFKMPLYKEFDEFKIHAFNSKAGAAIIKEFEDCLIHGEVVQDLPNFFTCHICLSGSPDFLSDKVVDPFPPMSLSQLVTLTDQITHLVASRGLGDGLFRREWDVKEEKDAVYLRVNMPAGVGKENVKVSVEQNILVIIGKESERWRRYSSRIDLPPNLYNIDQIKAEMKNGVLKVVIPKVEEKERKDVLRVTID